MRKFDLTYMVHVPSVNMEDVGFVTYTTASHRGAILTFEVCLNSEVTSFRGCICRVDWVTMLSQLEGYFKCSRQMHPSILEEQRL